jgi:5-methylcytosine-specific restriction endonuclease McrA
MERKLFSMRSILPLAKQAKGKPKRKEKIPVKLREEVWVAKMGRVFEGKCPTTWCSTNITVFDFESGHNIPESKGGATTIENLVPLCPRCNRSMGSKFTFDEWCAKHTEALPAPPPVKQSWWRRFMQCQITPVDTAA